MVDINDIIYISKVIKQKGFGPIPKGDFEMANITVTTQIFSGNLGDDWNDEMEAAKALSAFTKKQWMSELSEFIEAGHTVEIDIDVQRASGYCRSMEIFVDGINDSLEESVLKKFFKAALTDMGEIWEEFCNSEEAKTL